MRVITRKPILAESFSNLNGDSSKTEILAFQNWAVSKGYLPKEKANSKWNIDTDKAYDTYGNSYESSKSVGGFRFDLQPNIKSVIAPEDKYKQQLESTSTLREITATAERPKSENRPNYFMWALYGLGLVAVGYVAYKIVKNKN